jgi:hypothetical protein
MQSAGNCCCWWWWWDCLLFFFYLGGWSGRFSNKFFLPICFVFVFPKVIIGQKSGFLIFFNT